MPRGARDLERYHRRTADRKARGLCLKCGKRPPTPHRSQCEVCAAKRRPADLERYHRRTTERVAQGLCPKCGKRPPVEGGATCAPCAIIDEAGRCPERKNARSRKLFAARRAAGRCTSCGAPSQGASRCPSCAKRSYHRSDHFRGIPLWDPTWTVVEPATGLEHGPFYSEADVARCLVFEKLDRDGVEIVKDAPITASYTSWL